MIEPRERITHILKHGVVSMTILEDGSVTFEVEQYGRSNAITLPYEHASRLLRNTEQAQQLIRDEYDDEVIP